MNPSNEYVERFVEDVDLSKVLTAAHIMKQADSVQIDRGPRVALRLMKRLRISSMYVTDKQKRLLGAVTAHDADAATKEGKSLEDILIKDISKIHEDCLLTELFDVVSTAVIPVAVIDEENRLKGLIIRGALIGALSGNDTFINENGMVEPTEVEVDEIG